MTKTVDDTDSTGPAELTEGAAPAGEKGAPAAASRHPALVALSRFRLTPGMVSGLRYLIVLLLCLGVSAASSTYLGSSALTQLGSTAVETSAPRRQTAVQVKVPDTPVIAPAPMVQPSAPAAAPMAPQAIASEPAPEPESSIISQDSAPAGQIATLDQTAPPAESSIQTLGLDAPAAAEPVQQPTGQVARVRSGVNIRSRPSGPKIGVLRSGQVVDVLRREDGWIEVGEGGVALGWVWNTFLSIGPG